MTRSGSSAAVAVFLAAAAAALAVSGGLPALAPGEVAPIGAGEVGASVGGNLTIWFFDVGQGDAIAVQAPNGRAWLVDAGPPGAADDLIGQMRTVARLRALAAVTITHQHLDHYGGLRDVRDAFIVGRVTPANLDPANVSIELVAHNQPTADPNAKSKIYRVTYGGASVLLTGDATTAAEAEIIEEGAARIRADVLKIAHHGAADATGAVFLAAVDPSFAVISCGAGNDYGHPAPLVVNRICLSGAGLARTDQDGWIMATTDGAAWTVKTENGRAWNFISGA